MRCKSLSMFSSLDLLSTADIPNDAEESWSLPPLVFPPRKGPSSAVGAVLTSSTYRRHGVHRSRRKCSDGGETAAIGNMCFGHLYHHLLMVGGSKICEDCCRVSVAALHFATTTAPGSISSPLPVASDFQGSQSFPFYPRRLL